MSDVPSVNEQIAQAWSRVPAGERRELATRANLKGAQACLLALLFGTTLAFCFKENTILLGMLALLPVLYQVVATREWIEGKPRLAISYFVAEKAAAQYARHYNTADASVKVLFKGIVTPPTGAMQEPSPGDSPKKVSVWVALFGDRLIMFSEHPEGARLEFLQSLGEQLIVSSDTAGDPDMAPDIIFLDVRSTDVDEPTRWTLQSICPQALATCLRKVQFYSEQIRAEKQRRAALAAEKARLEQERLELRRQELLRIEEERQAHELAKRQQLNEELAEKAPTKPEPAAPHP